jgi:serine/threonine protein kinase
LFDNEKIAFNEGLRQVVISQMLNALNYMHQNKLVHRDIKSDNVVYSEKSPGASPDPSKLVIKLIDFGFAKAMKGN